MIKKLKRRRTILHHVQKDDKKSIKWCPSIPHCGNLISVDDGDEYREVECACGKEFCFSCTLEAHLPCSCLMWASWSKKFRDESENVNWITANTKSCPNCHKPVQKKGGCNHVTCHCGHCFCWLCGEANGGSHTIRRIRDHTCGSYKEDDKTKIEKAKREIFQCTHYYNRYKAHRDSLKLETELKNRVQEKIAILEAKKKITSSNDLGWAKDGFSRLFRSRKIISYLYPFAFYLFGNNLFKDGWMKKQRELKQNLFKEQQQQLEAMTERLSLFLEEPFVGYSGDKLSEIRRKIIDLSEATDNYCRRLYDCIENDLIGTIQIAPYRSIGLEKASEP
ncbi:OLC1v1029190C1 [Oldenlandia corymbosa var. corymbosa]|uniref:RBR-type E3 ubiquitin transferase n=1 Tax=Oldenlandia corymbosa var. corymbosa TaxID=529605 RepID=A0AAV1CDE6_OLDCO|nr:OLC1v1029190C1 [Oldenlandia corymbosa var. corymbosa]